MDFECTDGSHCQQPASPSDPSGALGMLHDFAIVALSSTIMFLQVEAPLTIPNPVVPWSQRLKCVVTCRAVASLCFPALFISEHSLRSG